MHITTITCTEYLLLNFRATMSTHLSSTRFLSDSSWWCQNRFFHESRMNRKLALLNSMRRRYPFVLLNLVNHASRRSQWLIDWLPLYKFTSWKPFIIGVLTMNTDIRIACSNSKRFHCPHGPWGLQRDPIPQDWRSLSHNGKHATYRGHRLMRTEHQVEGGLTRTSLARGEGRTLNSQRLVSQRLWLSRGLATNC